MKIIDKIREIRSRKNISQEYMANVLRIDTSNYHRLEKGVSPLSIDRLEAIAAALGITMSELLDYGEPAKKVPAETEGKHPLYLEHLEEEITFLRKQLQEKETQLSTFLYERSGSVSPERSFRTGRRG